MALSSATFLTISPDIQKTATTSHGCDAGVPLNSTFPTALQRESHRGPPALCDEQCTHSSVHTLDFSLLPHLPW
jgi:hypothetical protein